MAWSQGNVWGNQQGRQPQQRGLAGNISVLGQAAKPVGVQGTAAAPSAAWAAQNAARALNPMGSPGSLSAMMSATASATKLEKVGACQEKVGRMTSEFESLEKTTTAMLESAKVAMEKEDFSLQTLTPATEALEKQQAKLGEMQKALVAEVGEARKLGMAGVAVGDFVKLQGRCRVLWQTAALQINRVKPKIIKLKLDEEMKGKEVKDSAAFKILIVKVKSDVSSVESSANSVSKLAAPVVAKPPEEGEARDAKAELVQTAAVEALEKLGRLKLEVTEKTKEIQTYAPVARKTAQDEMVALQKKLNDAQRTLFVYKTFKVQLPKLVENHTNLKEVTDQLTGHDAALSKAEAIAKTSVITKQKCGAIDKFLEPVLEAVASANKNLLVKFRSVDAVTQEKVANLRAKGAELTKKVEAVSAKIKVQRDELKSEEAVETTTDLLEKAEASWKGCQQAEMPFLMGCEVLPDEQNETVLQECDDAAIACSAASNKAKLLVQAKLRECKSFEKALADSTAASLSPLLPKILAIEVSVAKFKKESGERKMIAKLSDAVEAVEAFEKKLKSATKVSDVLGSSSLEDKAATDISEAIEKAKTVLTEAQTSITEARKVATTKQREAKAGANHATIVTINAGLKSGQEKLQKISGVITKAEQLVKAKATLVLADAKAKEAEKEAEKAEGLVPAEGEEFTLETIAAVDKACVEAAKLIKALQMLVQPLLGSAPPKTKAALEELLVRRKEAQDIVDAIKTSTKDRRENALSENLLATAEIKTKAAETAVATMEQTEAPFLTGKEMDSKVTQEALAKCGDAAKECQEALTAASTFTKTKVLDVRLFSVGPANHVKDGFAGMAERVKKANTKLVGFKKDLEDRSKELRMVEAAEKVAEFETNGEKTLVAAEPFTKEGAENMTEVAAEAPLKAFLEVDQLNIKLLSATSAFLQARLKEQKGNETHLETVKQLQLRCKACREKIIEQKASVTPHEKRALGKKLLAEAKSEVAGLEAEVKKATDACAPLLEEGGLEFLVGTSLQTLASALHAHMQEKELAADDIFKAIGKGKPVSEKAFVSYLSSLPEDIDHDEINAFSEERRLAIFKHLAANGKAVTMTDFDGLFRQQQVCVSAVSLTDKFSVEDGETLCKVAPQTKVEIFGPIKEDEAGMRRSECKVGDQAGWITLKQGKTNHFVAVNAFKSFCSTMDKALAVGSAAAIKVSTAMKTRVNQGATIKDGPPLKDGADKEVWAEMEKLRTTATEAQKSLNVLKAKATTAKAQFLTKELAEKNAHVEARNLKEAAEYIDGPKAAMETIEADAKKVEEVGAPMVTLTGEDFQAFATPASVSEEVEKLAAVVLEKTVEIRASIKEQTLAVGKVNPPTGGTTEAKKQLKTMSLKLEEWNRKAQNTRRSVAAKVKLLVSSRMEPTAEAIRKLAQQKGKSVAEFFDSLKKKDEKIPEAAFCKMLCSLEGSPITSELAKLVCRNFEADGVSRENFMKFVCLYYKVVKPLAFTDHFDITKCETLRKVLEGEVVEVLEGPVADEANGMGRIRGKAVKDDVVGWLTISGSKGTAFLQKTTKPAPAPAPAAAKP